MISKIEHIFDYILALLLILNCQSIYQNSADKNYYIYELTCICIVFCSLLKLHIYGISGSKLRTLGIFSFGYYLYIIIFTLLSVEENQLFSFWARYGILPFVILFFMCNNQFYKKIILFKRFNFIVTIICIISLFFWIFGSFLNIISPTGYIKFYWPKITNVPSYYNLYFETQYIDFLYKYAIKRNTAIFTEGPMFSLVLMCAIMFYYRFGREYKFPKYQIWIYSLAMISNASVTGILFLVGIGILILYNSNRFKKYKNLIFILLVPCAIILGLYLAQEKTATGSYSLRMDDYIAGFKTWLESPLYGTGFNSFDAVVKNMLSTRGNKGYSNSFFAILTQGGILYLAMYIIPIIISIKKFLDLSNARNFLQLIIAFSYLYMLFFIIFQTCFINFFIWNILSLNIFFQNNHKKL